MAEKQTKASQSQGDTVGIKFKGSERVQYIKRSALEKVLKDGKGKITEVK